MNFNDFIKKLVFSLGLLVGFLDTSLAKEKTYTLLNVSYDPTRELYQKINSAFINHVATKKDEKVVIKQSHGGSAKQARSIVEGLEADIASLAIAYDIDFIAEKGLVSKDWRKKYPNNSSPYRSTIVFLVRKGNPKNIKDWPDLIKENIQVITPNPKTSGGARWNYLAAWSFALKHFNGDEEKAKEYIVKLYKNVPILDTGARASTITFVKRNIGDVLLSWENEAYLAVNELGKDKFDIIIPSISINIELPVAVVEKYATKHNTLNIANEYLDFLFTNEAQEIIAKNYYRPVNQEILKKYKDLFPSINTTSISSFGSWEEIQQKHFSDGGIFDQIYQN